MTWESLEGVCGGCLSLGRRVRALQGTPARILQTSSRGSMESQLLVCWECDAAAKKTVTFCEQVHRAQATLASMKRAGPVDVTNISSMSTLGTMATTGFDFEFHSQVPEIVKDEPQDFDDDQSSVSDINETSPVFQLAMNPIVALQTGKKRVSKASKDKTTAPVQSKRDEEQCVVMNDTTIKQEKKTSTETVEPDKITVKRINGSKVEEIALSDLKPDPAHKVTIKVEPMSDPEDMDESNAAVQLKPVEFIPSQRPGKITSRLMSEKEMLEERERERRAQPYAGSLFKCEDCILGYLNAALLEEHKQGVHSPELGAHPCDICGARLPSALNVANHRRAHYLLHECSCCGYARRRLTDVRRHVESSHEAERTNACTSCDQAFITRRQLKYHRETKHRARRECPQCDKTFANRNSYNQHIKKHAGLPLYECAHCAKSFRGKTALATHARTHAPAASKPRRDPAYCSECDVHFKNVYIYRQHLRSSLKHITRAELKFPCDACDKRFMLRRDLQHHYDFVHLRTNAYKCNVCDKSFINPRGLKRHTQIAHEGVRPAKNKICSFCDKAFVNKKDLLQHEAIHTGARPYTCDMCDSTFRQSAALYTHRRLVHLKLKRTKKETAAASVP